MIHTREQLINEIEKILYKNFGLGKVEQCAEELADFISTLDDPNEEWKNVP